MLDRIKEIIVEQLGIDIDVNQITPDTDLVDDLGLDSLDMVELIMEFEDEFEIEIMDMEAEEIKTVQDVINCIKKKRGGLNE